MAQTYQRQKRIGFPDRPAPAGFLFRLPCFRHSEQRIEPCRQVKPNLTDKSQPDAPICGQTSEQVCKSTGSSFYNSTARHRHTAAPEIAQIPTIRETPHQKTARKEARDTARKNNLRRTRGSANKRLSTCSPQATGGNHACAPYPFAQFPPKGRKYENHKTRNRINQAEHIARQLQAHQKCGDKRIGKSACGRDQ